ncbi:pilus assembly protein [Brevibacillus ruminantium]|uniref:Pilus assembly protein n=1 Tax=Brevibacillus ruminantium TaxID=2950604 RepID=A0ABY4WEU1_9BACL|nr:TadE family protein [Brevibacillus ruminantium]USG65675.1 pilus assembly protein [Brevibacillus ruminantium]
MRLKQMIRNEKGSMTVEFLAVLPLVFVILMICWQFLIGAYAVITAQAAANEAAKVYAITGNSSEALNAAKNVVSAAGGGIGYVSGNISHGNYFTADIQVQIDLIFIPSLIRDNMDPKDRVITFHREMTGRVIR